MDTHPRKNRYHTAPQAIPADLQGTDSRQNPASRGPRSAPCPRTNIDGTGEETEGMVKVNRTPCSGSYR